MFDHDHVSISARMSDDETLIEAYTDSPRPRAVLRPTLNAGAAPALRPGDDLDRVTIVADTPYGADYAVPAGDDLDICRSAGVVHPALWPDLATTSCTSNSLAEVGCTRDRSFAITERSLSEAKSPSCPGSSNGFCSRRTSNRRYALHAQRRHRHVNRA